MMRSGRSEDHERDPCVTSCLFFCQPGLGHEELSVAVEMLSAVAVLNEVLDTKDPQAVIEQLTDSPLGFTNMDQDNLNRWPSGGSVQPGGGDMSVISQVAGLFPPGMPTLLSSSGGSRWLTVRNFSPGMMSRSVSTQSTFKSTRSTNVRVSSRFLSCLGGQRGRVSFVSSASRCHSYSGDQWGAELRRPSTDSCGPPPPYGQTGGG